MLSSKVFLFKHKMRIRKFINCFKQNLSSRLLFDNGNRSFFHKLVPECVKSLSLLSTNTWATRWLATAARRLLLLNAAAHWLRLNLATDGSGLHHNIHGRWLDHHRYWRRLDHDTLGWRLNLDARCWSLNGATARLRLAATATAKCYWMNFGSEAVNCKGTRTKKELKLSDASCLSVFFRIEKKSKDDINLPSATPFHSRLLACCV